MFNETVIQPDRNQGYNWTVPADRNPDLGGIMEALAITTGA